MDIKDIRFEILKTRNKLRRITRLSYSHRIMRERLQNKIDKLEEMLKEGA